MDKDTLGVLLTKSLAKYNFKNYGSKLFYLELQDSILILEQLVYNSVAELYLSLIIKECHPEIQKITKSILKDNMLIDNATYNKLQYRTSCGYRMDFYDIPIDTFEKTIDELYHVSIEPFERNYVDGIVAYNALPYNTMYGHQIQIFKDSAIKIGHMEFAAYRGHDWFLSDYYRLAYEYKVDTRFLNDRTEKYIMENVIPNIPDGLKGTALSKWCNERCKEIFISKKRWRNFDCHLIFPFVDGKPLKFYGTGSKDGKQIEIYINEETDEIYHCLILEKSKGFDKKYEMYRVK